MRQAVARAEELFGCRTACVYLCRGGDRNGGKYTKIGMARDIEQRRHELQVGAPFKIEMVFAMRMARDDARLIERLVQKELGYIRGRPIRYNSHGEWFTISVGEAINMIEKAVAYLGIVAVVEKSWKRN